MLLIKEAKIIVCITVKRPNLTLEELQISTPQVGQFDYQITIEKLIVAASGYGNMPFFNRNREDG